MVAPISRREVAHVAESLRAAKRRCRGATLLIGAGCSVKGGIPVASGVIDEMKRQYPALFQGASPSSYASCMALLGEGERRDLIMGFVSSSKVNWAHLAMAQLMKEGFVDHVLTTNFDPLTQRAAALVGIFPAVYDLAAAPRYVHHYVVKPSIIFLHGQSSGFVQLHTTDRMAQHADTIRPVFTALGGAQPWIVAGYSGENDPVFEELCRIPSFDFHAYWIGYREENPKQHVQEQLLRAEKSAHWVSGYDADTFFVELARELGVFPPDLLVSPFTHARQVLENIAPLPFTAYANGQPLENSQFDLVAGAAAMMDSAKSVFEDGKKVARNTKRFSGRALKATYYLLSGDFEKVIQMGARTSIDQDLEALISLSLSMKAAHLLAQAQHRRTREGLEEAKGAIIQARRRFPDNAHAHLVDGTIHAYEAMVDTSPNRRRLLQTAIRRFRAAEAYIDANWAPGHALWAHCLDQLASIHTQDGDAAGALKLQAQKTRHMEAFLRFLADLEESHPGAVNTLAELAQVPPDDPRIGHFLLRRPLSLRLD